MLVNVTFEEGLVILKETEEVLGYLGNGNCFIKF